MCVELELCPSGDDPMTPSTGYYGIAIHTHGPWTHNFISGHFLISFNGYSIAFPALASAWNASACKSQFESLPNIVSVNCSRGEINFNGGSTYTVLFQRFSIYSTDNNLYHNDGSYSSWNITCSSMSDMMCTSMPCKSVCDISSISPASSFPGLLIYFLWRWIVVFQSMRPARIEGRAIQNLDSVHATVILKTQIVIDSF